MKAYVALLLTVVWMVAACSSAPEVSSTTTTLGDPLPERPELAVDQMVAALMVGDLDSISHLTSDHQLAILVSLEGGGPDELATMLASGVPPTVAENFWRSFIDGFPELVGESIEDMEFGIYAATRIDGIEFVSFPVAFGDRRAGTEWFVRSTDQGWQIDLLATFGPPFASALESMLTQTQDPNVIEATKAELPSIKAAYDRQKSTGASERVIEALERLVDLLES